MSDIINRIRAYQQEHLFPPCANWPKYFFDERVYARWASEEIISLLKQHPHRPPRKLISAFIEKMDELAFLAEKHETDYIFIIARDEAKNILTLFPEK